MTDAIKFTAEEIQQIAQLRQELAVATQQYGQLTFSKRMVEKEIAKIEVQYDALLVREDEVVAALTKKYGTGTLNIETGEFVPVK